MFKKKNMPSWAPFYKNYARNTFLEVITKENMFKKKSVRSWAPFYNNYTTDTFLEEIAKEKMFKKKNMRSWAPFYKNYTTDTFLEVITKEKMFEKNPLLNCLFKGLHSRNSYFNKSKLEEKYFLRAFWSSSETCLEEVYNEFILLRLRETHNTLQLSVFFFSFFSFFCKPYLKYWGIRSNNFILENIEQLIQLRYLFL